MLIAKVISGAQTGADIAGLLWAKKNNLVTGGHIPKGYRTDDGPRPEYAKLYGIVETQDVGYPLRTRMNVMNSDGTLLFGNMNSPGCKLTIKYCEQYQKPFFIIEFPYARPYIDMLQQRQDIHKWINEHNIHTLNIAGNREASNPGIQDALIKNLDFIFGDRQ